jgi:hypothetical protein
MAFVWHSTIKLCHNLLHSSCDSEHTIQRETASNRRQDWLGFMLCRLLPHCYRFLSSFRRSFEAVAADVRWLMSQRVLPLWCIWKRGLSQRGGFPVPFCEVARHSQSCTRCNLSDEVFSALPVYSCNSWRISGLVRSFCYWQSVGLSTLASSP